MRRNDEGNHFVQEVLAIANRGYKRRYFKDIANYHGLSHFTVE
jgi:hypothetical protein